jgi:hypothetical protein
MVLYTERTPKSGNISSTDNFGKLKLVHCELPEALKYTENVSVELPLIINPIMNAP